MKPSPVTLGTPLSPRATKVMLLGSGELGKEVLIALQRLGVETIAVDRYEHAPGQQVAHHARTITMSDPVQLKALIEAERPLLVVPEIEDLNPSTPLSAYHRVSPHKSDNRQFWPHLFLKGGNCRRMHSRSANPAEVRGSSHSFQIYN